MDESHQQLLQTLKSVVEGLLNCQVANVWNVYGGLSRLHSILERIFKHEFRIFKQNGEEDCWMFIQGLNWLQPSLATSPTPVCPNSPPPHPHTDKAMIWLHNNLETHSLSEKLRWLVSDEQHLASCYNPRAFLRQPRYVEAALICLRAIEQNQLPLLAEIHPCLYLSERSLRVQEKFHRRCSSFPDTIQRTMWSSAKSQSSEIEKRSGTNTEMSDLANKTTADNKVAKVEESRIVEKSTNKVVNSSTLYKIKPWRSLPDLPGAIQEEKVDSENKSTFNERKAQTEPSSPHKNEMRTNKTMPLTILKVDYKTIIKDSPFSIKVNKEKLKRVATSTSSGESMETITNRKPERRKKKSFIEDDGGRSIKPMSTGNYFPRPKQGQSITSFLSSKLYTQSSAELDRQNAHFSISEAIIAAIEQVKCNKWEKMMEEVAEESDEEINKLKQRIRVRTRLKQEDKFVPMSCSDTTTATDQSFSPRSSDSLGCSDDSFSTDGVEDLEVDQVTPANLVDINNSGLNLSMASLYSEADLGNRKTKPHTYIATSPLQIPALTSMHKPKGGRNSTSPSYDQENTTEQVTLSAEQVALSLLSKFSDKQLPKASEIQWLISEKEVAQKLLPLPNSFLAEDQDEMKDPVPLRGTENWAPPRPQIIFTPHAPPRRTDQMIKQNFRCAGCGVRVAVEYAHRFRYCDYLARYFCTGCHRNKQSIIPGRILSKWDFHKYPVSDFACNLIDNMIYDPLFNVNDHNPGLYKRVKNLEKVRNYRIQLDHLKAFLYICRFASQLKEKMLKISDHLLKDCDTYSIFDFINIKTSDLVHKLSQLIAESTSHVAECQLCQGRGHMCEKCDSKDVIFPWQLGKVTRCGKCGACYHTGCMRKTPSCPKCKRLEGRGLNVNVS